MSEESFKWGSTEGISAAVQRVKDSGLSYALFLTASDFESVLNELVYGYKIQLDTGVDTTQLKELIDGIVQSTGIEWSND